MNKIIVVGMGPGHIDYVLPVVQDKLRENNIIATNKRLRPTIDSITKKTKQYILIGNGRKLSESIEEIRKRLEEGSIIVAVSGDTGFYSMLEYLKVKLPEAKFEVYPGISSLQYLFSRLGTSYNDTELLSLHGKDLELKKMLSSGRPIGLLTDHQRDSRFIARTMIKQNIDRKICIGERLSYPDERIIWLTPEEALEYTPDIMSVVYIPGETR